MLVESLGRSPVGIGDHYLGEVFAHPLEDGAGLKIGPLVKNLTQIAKSIHPWHQHPESLVLVDLLRDPRGTEDPDVFHTHAVKQSLDLFGPRAGQTRVSEENV